jgi:hypothetical protein
MSIWQCWGMTELADLIHRQAYVEFYSPQASTATKHRIEQILAESQGAQKKVTLAYWNPTINPFKTLPKDAPTRGKDQSRAPSTYNDRSNNMGGNFGGSGGGFRGGRGGYNRGGMNQGGYNRNFNNNMGGFNNNMGGGYNGPMGGGGNFGFNNRGGMMGGGMRGGPGGMRGGRGGGMMNMNPMGGMPMGMPGNMGMGMMGPNGMPGKSPFRTLIQYVTDMMQASKVCLPISTLGSASTRTRAEVAIGGTHMEPRDLGGNRITNPRRRLWTLSLGIHTGNPKAGTCPQHQEFDV